MQLILNQPYTHRNVPVLSEILIKITKIVVTNLQ